MASFNKISSFVNDIASGFHHLTTDACYIYLTNSAPTSSNTTYGTPADLGTGNGYTTGGGASTTLTSSQTSGIYKLVLNSPTAWTGTTATGSSGIGPFRYCMLYNQSSTGKVLMGWWDYGSSITVNANDTFTITLDGTSGVIQLQ